VIASVRRSSLLTVFAVTAALAALAMTFAAQSAHAASYSKCTLSESEQDPPGEKPTYNTKLTKLGTSCSTAKKVMKAFHTCRSMTGYRCTSKLLSHWTCTGKKGSSTELLFTGTYTCTWGSRAIKGQYVQNT